MTSSHLYWITCRWCQGETGVLMKYLDRSFLSAPNFLDNNNFLCCKNVIFTCKNHCINLIFHGCLLHVFGICLKLIEKEIEHSKCWNKKKGIYKHILWKQILVHNNKTWLKGSGINLYCFYTFISWNLHFYCCHCL